MAPGAWRVHCPARLGVAGVLPALHCPPPRHATLLSPLHIDGCATCLHLRQAEARRIVEQRSGGDPSVGARDTGTRGGGGSSDDSSPSSSHLDTPPDASASRAGAAVATLPRPQPTKWLRIERSTVDFEAARARARARDPGAANRSSDQRGEAGGEAASSSGQGWRAWLPEWLPVQRVAPGEQLQRLRGRLEEVDALVRAHQRAVELEATGETPNSEADQY